MLEFVDTAAQAVSRITDGATVLIGGVGNAGQPMELIDALLESGATGLTVVNNNAGQADAGLALLIKERRVAKIICSFPRQSDSWHFDEAYRAGEIELELVPQGNLAERLRAGGAGIPAFYTRSGVGTQVAEGGLPMRYDADGTVVKSSQAKPTDTFVLGEGYLSQTPDEPETYVLERSIVTDFSLVHAWKGDRHGNLVFRKATRQFGPPAAMAGRVCIAQVEELVEPGEIDPDDVHLPGVFVHRIVEVGTDIEKRIEKRTVRASGEEQA